MKDFLLKNNLMLSCLYKFLDDEGQLDDLKDMAYDGGIDFDTVTVAGYSLDENDCIHVTVLYADECPESGVCYEIFTVNLYEFKKFMEENNYEI